MSFSISTTLFISAMTVLITALLFRKLSYYSKLRQKLLFSLGWLLFAIFWASRFQYYVFKTRSFIYLLLVPLAVLGCLTLSLAVIKSRTDDAEIPGAFFKVTWGATIASLLYMPFTLIGWLRELAIESVTYQTYLIIRTLGINNVRISTGPEFGYQSALIFTENGHKFVTHIAPNCTGIGSMAVVVAILAVTNITITKKIIYSIGSVLIIHILNLARNVMIAVGFGHQWFAFLEPVLNPILNYKDPNLVSFFVADKVLAQIGSAAALLLIFYIFLNKFPELQETLSEIKQFVSEEVFSI